MAKAAAREREKEEIQSACGILKPGAPIAKDCSDMVRSMPDCVVAS